MDERTQWRGAVGSAAENYQRDLVPAIFGPFAADLVEAAAPRPGDSVLDVARAVAAPDGAVAGWLRGDATALPFPGGSFDLVVCQQGLQFVPDRGAALQ